MYSYHHHLDITRSSPHHHNCQHQHNLHHHPDITCPSPPSPKYHHYNPDSTGITRQLPPYHSAKTPTYVLILPSRGYHPISTPASPLFTLTHYSITASFIPAHKGIHTSTYLSIQLLTLIHLARYSHRRTFIQLGAHVHIHQPS